jgi:biopolymer transport protein ExbB/TolQ
VTWMREENKYDRNGIDLALESVVVPKSEESGKVALKQRVIATIGATGPRMGLMGYREIRIPVQERPLMMVWSSG